MEHDPRYSSTATLPSDPPPPPSGGIKKLIAPIGFGALLLLKYLAKVKYLLLPALKFLPVILKTGGTMVLSVAAYAMLWGVWFAVGFVLLIFVHECGHLFAAKRIGLKVGAPVFIPFMGAAIALKEAPRNAWIEAQVGIGGPILGTVGAVACWGIFVATGNPMFSALAYTGFMLNLFNLAPIGFLDGGRIVTAISPWLWVAGVVALGVLMATGVLHLNFIIILILLLSIPRLISLFRKKSDEERRYYEVEPHQRAVMSLLYFGLIAALVYGMSLTRVEPRSQSSTASRQDAR